MTTLTRAKPAKRTAKSAGRKSVKRAEARRESKTVAAFNQWLMANAEEVGKWARQNTKKLTGKDIL
jgi:hypothetical protein